MQLQFAKMHGLGNDFVVFDSVNQNVDLSKDQIRLIADRRRGVGCDQILIIKRTQDANVDFNYQIFNSNGEEVEQCGNGARCVGKFLSLNKLTDKTYINIKTISGVYHIKLRDDGDVTVDMGAPIFEPKHIPFTADKASTLYEIKVDEQKVQIGAVSMGNPHAVIQVDDVNFAPISTLGPIIESHSMFPNKTNVGFMQVIDPRHIKLRVFERDVGETTACGTGACAAVVVGQSQNLLSEEVNVELPGGSLTIECKSPNDPVYMTGPAQLSFEGSLTL